MWDDRNSQKNIFKNNFVENASKALINGARILCDTNMIKYESQNQDSYNNEITVVNKKYYEISKKKKILELQLVLNYGPYLSGSLVAIGNAPTALFHFWSL